MDIQYIFSNPNSAKEMETILPQIIASSIINRIERDKLSSENSDRTA